MTALTPYLCLADCRAAVDWYIRVLGARISYDPIVMDDGRIGHVELVIGDARLMLADEAPEVGVQAPDPDRGNPVTLHLSLDAPGDVDRLTETARSEGAAIDREPQDAPYGRSATLHDPFGHRWLLNHESP